jgi:hypothetical protein
MEQLHNDCPGRCNPDNHVKARLETAVVWLTVKLDGNTGDDPTHIPTWTSPHWYVRLR